MDTKGGVMVEVRRWSERVAAVYLADGSRFGRFVCIIDDRESA
jgi:hypothetical protein